MKIFAAIFISIFLGITVAFGSFYLIFEDHRVNLKEIFPFKSKNEAAPNKAVATIEKTTPVKPRNDVNIINTKGYYPPASKFQYLEIRIDERENRVKYFINRQLGKKSINGQKVYVESSTPIINDEEVEKNRYYYFYSSDKKGNIYKVGEGKSLTNPKFNKTKQWELLLLKEMELGKKYIIRNTDSAKEVISCLGIKDIELPGGEKYEKCLYILSVGANKDGDFEKKSYYSKKYGLVKSESILKSGNDKPLKITSYMNEPL